MELLFDEAVILVGEDCSEQIEHGPDGAGPLVELVGGEQGELTRGRRGSSHLHELVGLDLELEGHVNGVLDCCLTASGRGGELFHCAAA